MAKTKKRGRPPKAKRGRPPKSKRAKQQYLPGLEPPSIPAIDKAADKFIDVRDDRFGIIKRFADAKLNLVSAMKEHGLTHYEYDGQVVDLDESASVKVAKKKAAVESGDESEESDE